MAMFIQKAIKRPGALTAKANAAGESPMAFAHEHDSDGGLTGQQSRFAEELQGFHKKKGLNKIASK